MVAAGTQDHYRTAVADDVTRLFTFDYYSLWYGILLPVVALLGVVGNLFAICVFRRKNMRYMGSAYIIALLLADCMQLVCILMLFSPSYWVGEYYKRATSQQFYDSISLVQKVFMVVYVLETIANSMVAWYNLALILEFLSLLRRTKFILKISKRGNVGKVIMSVPCLITLGHFLFFFSFQRRPVLYHQYEHSKICLSQLYQGSSLGVYEKSAYPVLFYILPYSFAVLCTLLCAITIMRTKSGDYVLGTRDQPKEIPRFIKSGRSIKMIFTLMISFTLFQGAAFLIYYIYYDTMEFEDDPDACHVMPYDRKFINAPALATFLYYLFPIIYSSTKLPIVLASSKNFRRTLCRYVQIQSAPTVINTPEEAHKLQLIGLRLPG